MKSLVSRGKYNSILKRSMPITIVFFFFNSFLLPGGLLYTTLLTPYFIFWIFKQGRSIVKIIMIWATIALPLLVFHYFYGISLSDYITSSILYFTCVIFSISFYLFLKKNGFVLGGIMDRIVKLNFIFVIIAILSLLVVKENNFLWYTNEITELIGSSRLKLFTTESSAYGTMLIPLIIYYFQFYFYSNLTSRRLFYLSSLILSLVLSLSYGNIGGLLVSIVLFILINLGTSLRFRYNFKLIFFSLIFLVLSVFLALGPLKNTGVVIRALNIMEGKDTSANGRSVESYMLAKQVIDMKNPWIGIGPGQFKILGKEVVNNYYDYSFDDERAQSAPVRIPSAVADMLAVFGYLGVLSKLIAEIFFFIKLKVVHNSYSLCLFIFMFVFQFLGSNTTNVVEYFIWILIFVKVFPDSYFKKNKKLNDSPNNISIEQNRGYVKN